MTTRHTVNRARGLGGGARWSNHHGAATADLVRDDLAADVTLLDLGEHRLRDPARPERIVPAGVRRSAARLPAAAVARRVPGEPAGADARRSWGARRTSPRYAPRSTRRGVDAHRRRRHRQDTPRAQGAAEAVADSATARGSSTSGPCSDPGRRRRRAAASACASIAGHDRRLRRCADSRAKRCSSCSTTASTW